MGRPSKITEDQRKQIIRLYNQNVKQVEICRQLGISYESVLKITKGKPSKEEWSQSEIDMLKDRFQSLPASYIRSFEFKMLCVDLKKSHRQVRGMIDSLELIRKEKVVLMMDKIPDPKPARKHPPIYTNSRTPYGIADEIWRGNRIY